MHQDIDDLPPVVNKLNVEESEMQKVTATDPNKSPIHESYNDPTPPWIISANWQKSKRWQGMVMTGNLLEGGYCVVSTSHLMVVKRTLLIS